MSLLLPKSIHFVGIGGIGMSGLAQMAVSLGCRVSGSDRALNNPENRRIVESLRAQGVKLYQQDGSRYADGQPDALVYSTAIENDNPDFVKAGAAVKRLHRSQAMEVCLEALSAERKIFGVAGTCGKTTVTAWLSEALCAAGNDPGFLCGGLLNGFTDTRYAGNYRNGGTGVFVLEADESDKSLLNYRTDHVLVLNIGTDHYSREELVRVFRDFVNGSSGAAVLNEAVWNELGGDTLNGKPVVLFSLRSEGPREVKGCPVYRLDSYAVRGGKAYAGFDGCGEMAMPSPGIHMAENALAVYAALRMLGYGRDAAFRATGEFHGVWRRFDHAGRTEAGAEVYDDYAHNVQKIESCVRAAQEISEGAVICVFQPHGFGPLGFMREELYTGLQKLLRPCDRFSFLPVYYAGGTTSFKPKASEVAEEFRKKSGAAERYPDHAGRAEAAAWVNGTAKRGDVVLVLGGRDNSLSDWALELCGAGKRKDKTN